MAAKQANISPSPVLPVRIVTASSIIEPVSGHIEFDDAERGTIASFLGLSGFDSFRFDYTITPLAKDRFALKGRVQARFAQNCVITLEPVEETMDEAIDAELWPADQIKSDGEPGVDARLNDVPEDPPVPIADNKADLAAFAVEILSSGMNPYPRKPDAELDWHDPASGPDGEKLSPFAALAKLKEQR